MKKIAFIGSHAVGKTTLVYELASILKKMSFNVEILTEVSRDSPFPINEETTKKAQRWILFTQYIREIEKENYDYLICDRSLIDNYAYYAYKFGRDKAIEPFILEHMKTYSNLFKVPINEKYRVNDGIRSIKKDFQKSIDKKVDELLDLFNISFENYIGLGKVINSIK